MLVPVAKKKVVKDASLVKISKVNLTLIINKRSHNIILVITKINSVELPCLPLLQRMWDA